MRGTGGHRVISRFTRVQVRWFPWLRRRKTVRHRNATSCRKAPRAGGAYPDVSGRATSGYRMPACLGSVTTTVSTTCIILPPALTSGRGFSAWSAFEATW